MKFSNLLVKLWLFFLIPCFIIRLYLNFLSMERLEERRSINNYVGSKFELAGFLDREGREVDLDFSRSKYTIIDFWHTGCPACIMEMKAYPPLLQDVHDSISIVSISINDYGRWANLFKTSTGAFVFLRDSTQGWQHLVMKSNTNPKLNNIIPSDNVDKLMNTFQTSIFPTYLVVDRNRTIVATPASAVDFIKVSMLGRSKFSAYLTNTVTWSSVHLWGFETLILYSGFFWILFVATLGVRKLVGAKSN
jgi:thiol-disulfide isomerase/thioredoxin